MAESLIRLKLSDVAALPRRAPEAHKGNLGHLLLVAGSEGMSGACVLAARAALRSGVGLLTATVPRTIRSIVATIEPCCMTIAVPADGDGCLAIGVGTTLRMLIRNRDALAIGPGLGSSVGVEDAVRVLLMEARVPLVLDADALNTIASEQMLEHHHQDWPGPRIITPHPGEFARLTGLSTAEIQHNRESTAVEYAARHHVITVLKGHQTVVTDGTRVYVNETGNAGMATGGSGDVLTGLVGSLLAQGIEPFAAAVHAVHAHGVAGDLAAAEKTQRGMIASDLIDFLPATWKSLQAV